MSLSRTMFRAKHSPVSLFGGVSKQDAERAPAHIRTRATRICLEHALRRKRAGKHNDANAWLHMAAQLAPDKSR